MHVYTYSRVLLNTHITILYFIFYYMNFSSQLQYDRLAKIRTTMKERRENTNNFTKKVSENVKKTIDDTDDTFMDPVNTDTNLNTKNSREIGGFILDDDILGEPTCPDIEKNPVNRKM